VATIRHRFAAFTFLLALPAISQNLQAGHAAAADSARNVVSLNGPWEIVFDPKNEGRRADWFHDANFPQDRARTINVPCCWELVEKDYEGVAFYRRKFTVPADWEGKIVRLKFDAVNFQAEVWVNDQAVGFHEGGFTPFTLRVDPALKPGRQNTIIVRVLGPILLEQKRIEGIGPMETPQWRGAIAGGIWQPVRLIATGPTYVRDVFIEPCLADDSATFHLELRNDGKHSAPTEVAVTVRSAAAGAGDQPVAEIKKNLTLVPGTTKASWKLLIPSARYWSPDDPFLYQAEVSLTSEGVVSDRWMTRFGMREFTVRNKRFYLNGKPIYLKAAFFEGLYPRRLAYPDSREMVVREITLAKQAGFNMIRPWRKPAPPMWLDLADELGVLVVGPMAIECMDLPVETARLPGWVENEIRQTILRDRNRACIVQWELFNELKRPVLKQLLHRSALLARELDPTRLILDESGGWAQGANLYLPYRSEPIKFNDIHYYPGPQVNEEVFTKLVLTGSVTHAQMRAMGLGGRLPGRNVVPGLMTFFSELGYGSLPNLVENNRRFAEECSPLAPATRYHRRLAEEHRKALRESGLDKVYPDLEQFCLDQQQIHGLANRRMIEAVRCNPNVQGYCVHALVAGDWILGAGLLDLFRNPKTLAYQYTKAASAERIVVVRLRPRNIYAAKGTVIEITGVNEREPVPATLKLTVLAEGEDGRVVSRRSLSVVLATGISRLLRERLDTHAMQGSYTLAVELLAEDGRKIADNRFAFNVFPPSLLPVPNRPVVVVDFRNRLVPFLRKVGVPFTQFDPETDHKIPVLVAQTKAANARQRRVFEQLVTFARVGGTVVYLEGGRDRAPWGRGGPSSPLLPVRGRMRQSIGLWTCIPHIVRDHPIFNGLPVNCMMGPVYENVWADRTLSEIEGEVVVGTVAFDWFPDYDLRKRHYYGPGDTWWGADLAVVPVGSGRCIISHLRLLENLGRDPVADKILFNLINWAGREQRRKP